MKKFYDHPANRRYRAKRRLKYKLQPGEPRASNHKGPLGINALRTMDEVAAEMGIHKSRVHQLERMALWKIRQKGIKL
jgi:DNA-directed RNA polymerase sigma subunit (sigma70/sigma32)